MQVTKLVIITLAALGSAATAHAAGVNRKIIAEIDPVAPSSSMYEEEQNGVVTSKWGALVDFNVGGVVSTGPEIWTGTFSAKGGDAGDPEMRREDMWPGERHKLDAIRLRWNITRWEHDYSMRGWYLKGGYSYTRINSRANRYTEIAGAGDAVPANVTSTDPMDETDLVSDLRHGAVFGFGNRWMLLDQKMTVTLGASFTSNFKRIVTVDSKDPHALADYEAMIESLPDTRMTTRPTPEANLTFGYAW
jgi:hypothetical protein